MGTPSTTPNPKLWARGLTGPDALAFRRMPILWAAAWFCLGIVMARFNWQPPVVWITALALLCVLLRLRVQTAWIKLVPLAGLWVATGFCCLEIQPAPPTQAQLRGFADGLSRSVHGHIVRVRPLPPETATDADTDGYEEAEKPAALSIDLAVDQIEDVTPDTTRMVATGGGIRATVIADAAHPTLHCGDTLEAPMRLRLPDQFRDPGAWQYGDFLLQQGIGAHAVVRASRLAVTPHNPELSLATLHCRLAAAQTWASKRMLAYIPSPANRALPHALRLTAEDAGMLNAMLFGDRQGLNHALRLGFEQTGSFHLFVVSGMHVALIAFGLFWIAGRLRLPQWAATATTLTLTTAFALLTGFGVPVQRALWMTALFLIAKLLDRERGTLNALGVATLGVLVWSPSSLFDASFEMTFAAIVAVAGIAIPLAERTFLPHARAARRLDDTWRDVRFPPALAQFRVVLRMAAEPVVQVFGRRSRNLFAQAIRATLWAAELALVALVVEAVMALPMAIFFHRAVALGLPANIVSVPLVGVLVPIAIATFLATLITPWLAALPAAVTAILLHAVRALIHHLSHNALANLRIPPPAWPVCALAIACIALACWAARRRGFFYGALAAATLPAIVALVLWPEPPILTPNLLEVTAIDVGQGDSLFLAGPHGRTLLVDAGGPVGGLGPMHTAQTTGFDLGEEVVSPFLWSRRIRRLDVVALTHEHSDHMGGMPAILRNFRPSELWVGIDVPSAAYTALLDEANTLGITVRHLRAGDTIDWDGTQISVLGPARTYTNPKAPKNDDSLVLHIQFGASSTLLEGDAERPEENTLHTHPVTLLKVAHHGSATSSTEALLAAAQPCVSIISVGRGNTFGHPRAEVIARLTAHGTHLYRTDMLGLTTFLLSPDGRIEARTSASNPVREACHGSPTNP